MNDLKIAKASRIKALDDAAELVLNKSLKHGLTGEEVMVNENARVLFAQAIRSLAK